MHCPLRAQRGHALVALVVLSTLLASPTVAAEIFKCVAKDGSSLYQNFPCHIDSLGSLQSNPVVGKTPSTLGAVGQEKPKIESVKMASTAIATSRGEPQIGMTSDEVRTLLGEPEEMVDDEPADGGRVSIWRYADGRSVQFDHKHHVFGVQR